MAEICKLERDYHTVFSMFSEGVCSSPTELNYYLKMNPQGNEMEAIRYGPCEGTWIASTTLMGASHLIGCFEIVGIIFGFNQDHKFKNWLNMRDEKHADIAERYHDQTTISHLKKGSQRAHPLMRGIIQVSYPKDLESF